MTEPDKPSHRREEQAAEFLLRPLRPKWAVILALAIVLPLALYAGVLFGLSGVDYLFPSATVRCH